MRRILQLLATLSVVVALVLSQSVSGAVPDVAETDGRYVVTQLQSGAAIPIDGGGYGGVPFTGCHHSSCSQSFLVKANFGPPRSSYHSQAWLLANEHNPRPALLDRDPPVPRSQA
jgi:hypothetical protein